MIDSLLGLFVLGLLTSWIVSAMSIQSRLLASLGRLNSREQIDYLRAAKTHYNNDPSAYGLSSVAPLDPCSAGSANFLRHLKSFQPPSIDNLGDLRRLLIDPHLMARAAGVSQDDVVKSLQAEEQLPFTTSAGEPLVDALLPGRSGEPEPGDVIRPGDAGGDWSIVDSRDERVPLWICPP